MAHIVYSAGLVSVVSQPAERKGVVPPAVVLHNVLHVPALASNLLSVFHLTHEKGYTVEDINKLWDTRSSRPWPAGVFAQDMA
ncbi:hypothetical protein NUW54_g1808 [Trametes sanguinea]|uniref:Uncharacterized protein n=1 Tax=Trametes sanguinea TaxID=158606 RepID=A0ACC1Q7Y2_9APHY|nr:hypothetical protein NUW54_g1808 [Trametes sanguinea]